MKKVIAAISSLLLSLMLLLPSPVLAEEDNLSGFSQIHVGLDSILVGKIQRDENGVPQKLVGLSAGLGIGYRKYFSKQTQLKGLHPFWEVGTVLLILPYGGIGAQYSIPTGNDPTGKDGVFSIGIGAYLFTIIPGAGISISYSF
jgi:hypothetical protein